jgi:uncharacterized iron-regulated membrane protein
MFLSGIWVSRAGKPLNGVLLTIHKLVGLAAGVFLVAMVYQLHQGSALGGKEMIAVIVCSLLFLGAVVAGGVLSLDKPVPGVVLRLHQIGSVLAVLCTATTLYFLLSA